jgi:iron complex outermembrane receptor protein
MRDYLATTAALALIATAAPVLAQATDPSPPPAEPEAASTASPEVASAAGGEGDIIVTARRREESIRDVPGTLSAVTADQLASKGPVVSTTDLLNSVAGVRFNNVSSENLSEISIRGSGTQRATGADSSVGLYVNGAYVGSSTLGGRNFKTLDYFDIERVEALQGPQGGLYGRNSEFGVVNIVLAKPKFENSGWARDIFTFDQNQNRLAGVVNQQLSDEIAIRVGGETYGQTKGFYYDPNHDRYYDRTDGWNGRGQIRYKSGPLDVTLLVEAQDLRLPTFVNSYVVPAGVNASLPLGFTQDRFILPHEGQDGLRQNVQRAMLLADYDFGFATLTSTTMAMRWRSQQQFAALIDVATAAELQSQGQAGEYPFGQTRTDVTNRTLYQDLHLSGSAAGGNLSWIFGGEALYQRDLYHRTVATSPCTVRVGASFCTGTPAEPICVSPLPTSAPCPTPFPATFGVDSTTRQRIYSFAAYGSLEYRIGNLTLAGEARFTHDYKTSTQEILALYTSIVTTPESTFVFKKDQPTFTGTVSYKFPDLGDALLYAKVGTGYRAGGVNNGVYVEQAPNPFVPNYGNEDTISYEAGVKANLTRSIFARVSGYISRTHDAITAITDGCTPTNACGRGQTTFNVNGGTIHAKGLEMALDGRFPIGAGVLTTNLSASTQQAEFAEVPTGRAGLPLLDSSVPQIPDWTLTANVNYRHRFTDRLSAFVNGNWSGQRGGVQDAITLATPAIALQDFDVFGAQVGVDYANIQLALSVRNLTDQQIEVLRFRQGVNPLSVRYNQPRTFAASLGYRW